MPSFLAWAAIDFCSAANCSANLFLSLVMPVVEDD